MPHTNKFYQKTNPEKSGVNSLVDTQRLHHVIVTDENGIQFCFNQLKKILAADGNAFLTFVYFLKKEHDDSLFKAELDNLKNRFLHQLLVFYVPYQSLKLSDQINKGQTILEVVINSNTKDIMQFHVNGCKDIVDLVMDRLYFLGIDKDQIISQIS
jgi:hypothetical protein